MEDKLLLVHETVRKHVTFDVDRGYILWDETGAYEVGSTHYVGLLNVMFEEYCKQYLGDPYYVLQ